MQKKILSDTKIVGIFGNPISHSLSPIMHNSWFKKYKLNFVYLAFNIFPQNLKSAVEAIKSLNIVGINVTVPYKVEVMKYLDKIDVDAKNIGSVNTIVNKNNKLYGYNTDWLGFIEDLKCKISSIKETITSYENFLGIVKTTYEATSEEIDDAVSTYANASE